MNVGIIGCGLIGRKRALNIQSSQIHTVCDIDLSKAKQLSKIVKSNFTDNYNKCLHNFDSIYKYSI